MQIGMPAHVCVVIHVHAMSQRFLQMWEYDLHIINSVLEVSVNSC